MWNFPHWRDIPDPVIAYLLEYLFVSQNDSEMIPLSYPAIISILVLNLSLQFQYFFAKKLKKKSGIHINPKIALKIGPTETQKLLFFYENEII